MSEYSKYPERKKSQMRKAHRKWAQKNPRTAYYKQYDAKRTPEKRMYRNAKSRAHQQKVEFNISVSDIIISDKCPICEVNMKVSNKKGGELNSPTLDKIIPSKGYTKDNISVICKRCNSCKGNADSLTLRKIADFIDSHISCTP